MSRWTHIRGCIELDGSPYELKGKKDIRFGSKDVYLPFPEEQLQLNKIKPRAIWEKNKETDKIEITDSGLQIECTIYSLPRVKPIIEKAVQILPQGESGFYYSLSQDYRNGCHSSSDFDYPCEEKTYKKKVEDYFNEGKTYRSSFKDLNFLYNIDPGFVDYVDNVVMGVRDDLRDCDADTLMEKLEKFFLYLDEHNINIEDGYLEWEDEYLEDVTYVWRCSRVDHDLTRYYAFYKIDKKTNKYLWSKTYRYQMEPDAKGEWDYDTFARPFDIIEESFDEEKGGEEKPCEEKRE